MEKTGKLVAKPTIMPIEENEGSKFSKYFLSLSIYELLISFTFFFNQLIHDIHVAVVV